MRAVLQRVKRAQVTVGGEVVGRIERGLLVLAGVAQGDADADLDAMAAKIVNLRIFADENNKFNLSLLDVGGALLVVSQFTLFADCRKGRRPSFLGAAPPAEASALFDRFVAKLRALGAPVQTGVFQAMMEVELVNDGPVTIMLDSEEFGKEKD
ncbi:MAG: D-aminoacyl-tRNA deacylase [bacterium]